MSIATIPQYLDHFHQTIIMLSQSANLFWTTMNVGIVRKSPYRHWEDT
jgi:hypothetical protein